MHDGSPQGMGECWRQPMSRDGADTPPKDALKDVCQEWQILAMAQVKSRSSRQFIWNAYLSVRLEG